MDNNNRTGRPGITFTVGDGCICLHQTTLNAIGRPDYFKILFDKNSNLIALQGCKEKDVGAVTIYYANANNPDSSKRYERVYSKRVARMLYDECGWNPEYSYRIYGTEIESHQIALFSLEDAEILNEN